MERGKRASEIIIDDTCTMSREEINETCDEFTKTMVKKESKLSKIETIIMSRLSKKQKSALQDVIDEAKENLESLKENNMKYKVGDKVLLRDDLVVGECYGDDTFEGLMVQAQAVTIDEIYDNEYYIKEDNNIVKYGYTDEMIVGLAE